MKNLFPGQNPGKGVFVESLPWGSQSFVPGPVKDVEWMVCFPGHGFFQALIYGLVLFDLWGFNAYLNYVCFVIFGVKIFNHNQ